MRLFRPWHIFQNLYPEGVFRIKSSEAFLCLTFDDGPDPVSTPLILDILHKHNVKATFFCTGIKAEKYPGLISSIRSEGHITGNHGYSHLDGWRTGYKSYINDIQRADEYTSSQLFRPPYGRITFMQYAALRKKYRVFFWDLMPYDFDPSFGSVNTLTVMKQMIREGSVVVLHDSPLSCAVKILADYLNFSEAEGYRFATPDSVQLCATL